MLPNPCRITLLSRLRVLGVSSIISSSATEKSFQAVSAHTDPVDLRTLDDVLREQVSQAGCGNSGQT